MKSSTEPPRAHLKRRFVFRQCCQIEQWATLAQLFPGLGDFRRAITTTSLEAQAYFDPGMRFQRTFNRDEATKFFAMAAIPERLAKVTIDGLVTFSS